MLAAHAVPARPRPHRPLQGVPPAQAQDAGLHRARGRPLPHAAHAHARGVRHLAHGRPRAAAERGPDRGDRRSATTSATRRSATPARQALDGALRARFGRGFRHNEHSLRVVDALERDGRGPEPHARGPRRHPATTPGPTPPASLEGRIVKLVDRVAYINHDIDDAAARRRARRRATCRQEPIALLGATGSRADRRARARPRRDAPTPPATSCQSAARRRGDARAARVPVRRASTGRGRCARRPSARPSSCAALFDHYCDRRSRPMGDGAMPTLAERASSTTSPGMTDRFALRRFDELLRAARPRRVLELAHHAVRSRSRPVKERARPRRARRARAPSCARRGDEWVGPLPVPRGAHARRSRSTPSKKLYHCFGCGAKGDVIDFVAADRGARLHAARSSGSPTATASSSSTRRTTRVEQARRRARRPPARAARRDAPRFYAARPARAPRARRRAAYLAGARPAATRCIERFRLGSRRRAGTGSSRAAQRRGYTRRGARRRRASRGAAAAATRSTASAGGSCSRSPTRAAASSASAGASCRLGRRAEVREHAREPALPQGRDALRPAPRAHRDRASASRRSSSRATPT